MEFEWNPVKSRANQQKHRVSFEKAVSLWEQPHLEVEGIAKSRDGETRSATLGRIGSKLYVAIWTKRNGKTRLITVRRARKNEKESFLKKIQNL